MGNIVGYLHYGKYVFVDEELKGKHKEHCLCFRCRKFVPKDRELNCRIAELNFANCRLNALVLPVYECPEFKEKQ